MIFKGMDVRLWNILYSSLSAGPECGLYNTEKATYSEEEDL